MKGINMKKDILCGPFTRELHVRIDENRVVSTYLSSLKDACMIDVGAHHGYALTPFAKAGWSVFALEPDPKNRAILLERLPTLGSKITIDTKAAYSKSGDTLSFYDSEESTGISSIYAFTEGHKHALEVETITLDDFIAENAISQIDYLKIDVEGAEMDVFRGFNFSPRPRVICAEFEDSKSTQQGYTTADLATFLQNKGYRVFVSEWHPIIRYGISHDWRAIYEYSSDHQPPNDSWGNLIAIREDQDIEAFTHRDIWKQFVPE